MPLVTETELSKQEKEPRGQTPGYLQGPCAAVSVSTGRNQCETLSLILGRNNYDQQHNHLLRDLHVLRTLHIPYSFLSLKQTNCDFNRMLWYQEIDKPLKIQISGLLP